jgi:O-antigen/teichoic acid export membrane protein
MKTTAPIAGGRRSAGLIVSSSSVLVARAVAAIAFAASTALLARILGPSDFGYYSLIASVTVAGGFVAAAGVNRSLLKQIALDTTLGNTDELAAQQRFSARVLVLSVPAVSALTGFGLVYAVNLGVSGMTQLWLAIATSLLVALSALQLVVADGLRGYGRRVSASFLEGRSGGAVSFVALTLVLLPFVGHTMGLTGATALNVLAFALVLPVWWLLLRPKWNAVMRAARASGRVVPDGWKRPFIAMSAAFVGTQLLAFASNQGDLWVVAATLPGKQLSLFAAAFRLVTVIGTPLLALQLTLTPTAAALYGAGKLGELESVSRRAATLATIPALLSLVVILAAPEHLMTLIFGAGFVGGASIMLWLTAGQVVNSLTGIGGQILTMTGHQRDVLWISTVALVLKLAIGIPVALTVGVVGYAAVTSIMTALMNVAFVASVRWRMGIWCLPGLRLDKGTE